MRPNGFYLIALSLLLMSFSLSVPTKLQYKADDVLGVYWTPEKDGKIKIYKKGSQYYGKLIQGETPDRLDKENPDPSKRNRKIVGLDLFKSFVWDPDDDEWDDGTVYDPESGKTYDCYMWLEDNGQTLVAKGYIGISLIGREEEFERIR